MKKINLMAIVLMSAVAVKAQNNAIFNGGGADGWSRNGYAQTSNNIFAGGNGDGWHFTAFTQTANNIYKGGDGDGWSAGFFAQAGNAIYNGGDGDGWAKASFLQVGNGIFNGGVGDGWSYLTYLRTGNNIFFGGAGDGWASTYRPLGALPVTLLSFTAEKRAGTSLLKWQTSKEEGSDYFDVERSTDAVSFVKVGTVAAAGNSTTPTAYTFTDAQPAKGYNYYRLKQVDRNGAFVYTPVRMVLFDAVNMQNFKVYPVPVTAMLTIELPAKIQNENIVINLSNAVGVMVQQIKLSASRADNRKTVSLLGLPPGAYTVQISSASFNGSQVIIKQ